MMDSVPTVFITGQVRTDLIGTDGFQEADIIGITLPIVKHSFLVTDPRQIPEYVHEAFHIASTGRPGPVLVDIPQDLSRADIDYEPRTEPVDLPGYKPPTEGNIKQIRIAAKALANARRPVIYAGGGVVNANASEELREFCRLRPLPGHLDPDGPRRLPGPARAVARDARHARHPDRQLRDGRRRPDRRDRRPLRRPDHRQARPSSRRGPSSSTSTSTRPRSRRTSRRTSRSSATPSDVLPKLTREYRALQTDSLAPRRLVEADPRAGRASYPLRYEDSSDAEIKPQFMIEAMYEATEGDAIITSDVGQHQMWAAQYYDFAKPRRWINSGGLGTMGFGLPAAIGAKVACPTSTSSASPATAA